MLDCTVCLAHPAWSSVLTGTTFQEYIEFHLKRGLVLAWSRNLFQSPVTEHNPSRVMACLTEVMSLIGKVIAEVELWLEVG